VNGRITSVQRRLHTDAGSYHWLAFDRASDTGLFVTYGFCGACRPRTIDVAHLTVVGPAGRLATVACSTGPLCRARRLGTAATLGPGPDELTVESGSRTLVVIGYDGSLRRNLDLTATIARGQDVSWLAWSPDGSRLAVVAGRRLDGADVWLLEGDELLTLAYSGSNPWLMRPAWSPDGQRLMVDRMVPTRSGRSFRSSGADVVVFAGTSAGWSPPMTPRVLYRSNRGFDNAGNLAWSPDGTRIAVRVRDGVVEISAEDGRVLARHPQSRRTSGWLIWPRKDP
jgi:dipeptidyl aminopeptidase/acylaminoacyl peptidase